MTAMPTRGSRKHMLEWVRHPGFLSELNDMIACSGVVVDSASRFMPTGLAVKGDQEAQLHRFGPDALPGAIDWAELDRWWLAISAGQRPTWDLAATASLNGRPAIVLVEAKANVPELSPAGKAEPTGKMGAPPSIKALRNHAHIANALAQAQTALNTIEPGFTLSRDVHYQLSNRIAFAWKLASLGLPTVLVYLGFTGDTGLIDGGAMFESGSDWDALMRSETVGMLPANPFDRCFPVGGAGFTVLVRSRPCISVSAPRHSASV